MTDSTFLTKIISEERIAPYLRHHNNDIGKAMEHYRGNILISESFYPLLSIIEIGLRKFQLVINC